MPPKGIPPKSKPPSNSIGALLLEALMTHQSSIHRLHSSNFCVGVNDDETKRFIVHTMLLSEDDFLELLVRVSDELM